jgi:MFS transporter, DHA1 family, tetracycline resistance protein
MHERTASRPGMNKRLVVILSIITIDAIGIGLIFPILPSLLRQVTGSGEVSVLYGVILALYSLMQFIFSPVLGALSDRFGRRPVLLVSIAGAAIDLMVMALSKAFWVLLIGRAIAGMTAANLAVATAYVSDITEEQDRAKRFGYLSAGFGIGFIIGPVLGGLLGVVWLRAPFFAAAVINAVNFALVLSILPESRSVAPARFDLSAISPLAPMRRAFGLTPLLPLFAIYLVFGLVGNIPGTIWVLYGQDRFEWNSVMVGLSLAAFGLCHAAAQAFLTGPMAARFGEIRTIVIGILFDASSFVVMGVSTRGWVAFALAPFFALGGVGVPALQSLMANQVGSDKQGELQGILASLASLTAIVGPLVGTSVYAATKHSWTGAVWILSASLYMFTIPLLRHRRPVPATTG